MFKGAELYFELMVMSVKSFVVKNKLLENNYPTFLCTQVTHFHEKFLDTRTFPYLTERNEEKERDTEK